MTEIEYRICKVIKYFKDIHRTNPTLDDISKTIQYSNQATWYHIKKLQKIGIVGKNKDKTFRLKINNLK